MTHLSDKMCYTPACRLARIAKATNAKPGGLTAIDRNGVDGSRRELPEQGIERAAQLTSGAALSLWSLS